MSFLKQLIAINYPYYRRCGQKWCWRGMTYDNRCWKHQDWGRDGRL